MAFSTYQNLKEVDLINYYEDKHMPFLEIQDETYKAKFTSFKNIKFQGSVHFKNTNLSIGLIFENCDFSRSIVFNNVSANGFDDKINPDSQSLVFKNCTFHETVQFFGADSVIERSVLFEGSTFEKGLDVQYMNIGEESFTIRKCIINIKLDLFHIKAKQDISLAHNTVKCFTRISESSCNMLTIIGANIFKEDLHIRAVSFLYGIAFHKGVFKEVSISQAHSGKGGLSIIESEFEKSVFVNFHSGKNKPINGLYSFYLRDSKFNNGIYINGTEDILADNPFVEEIEIAISSELKGDIVFRNLHVGIVSISGYNNNANVFLEHLYINQLKIKALINNAGLIFSMIKASYIDWYNDDELKIKRINALYIDSSNFGKAQFFQVDFASFDTIVFHNNILTDISTSLIKWFSPRQLENGVEKGALIFYKESLKTRDKKRIENDRNALLSTLRSKQDIYRQIKFASQKQGDIPQALEFQRHEMNYYRQIVKYRRPRSCAEHLILWSNQSNNFGQDWLKAAGLFIIWSFLFYLPVGFLNSTKLDYSHFANSWPDIALNLKLLFHDNLRNWITLMNPTHSMKDINENISNLSGWIYFWDYLSRIIAAYFLFQIVSAFRKFNK